MPVPMIRETPATVPEPAARPAFDVRLLAAYRVFPVLLLPAMLVASRAYGITWDEKTHQMYGEAVFRFLAFGEDSHWFHPSWYMYLVGGLFDALCAAAQRLGGDPWTTRHYVNAAFGWLGIVYAGRLGRLLAGPGIGLLAMVMLTLSPRYFADSMNNPKDLPFAALSTAALFYIYRLRPRFPFLGVRELVPLTIAIALALNVRAGALLLLVWTAVALAVLTVADRAFSPRRLSSTALRFAVLTLLVLVAGTAFWPWAQKRPLERPIRALELLSKHDWDRTVLFAGADVRATALPLDYVPHWTAVTTPPVVLLGAALSLALLVRRPRAHAVRVAGLWLAALFPAVYVAVRHAVIYDGTRHLLFAYPPLVVLAACGWQLALQNARRHVRALARTGLALGLLEPLWFVVRNHPNECVYFNALVGGPRGAFARYELDYWGNSIHQAMSWIEEQARGRQAPLVVSGFPPHVVRDEARRRPGLDFARNQKERHHLDVFLLRGTREGVLELAARTDVLHRVETADGALLAIVVPGPAYAALADGAPNP